MRSASSIQIALADNDGLQVQLEDLKFLGNPAALLGVQKGSWPQDRNDRLAAKLCAKTGCVVEFKSALV